MDSSSNFSIDTRFETSILNRSLSGFAFDYANG